MALKDKNTTGLNRRSFMKGAGLAALAGGAVASAPSSSLAQESSINIPKLAGGKYDFDTPYNRVGSDCARWDSPALRYPNGTFKFGMGVASMDFECAPCITEALRRE